MISSVSKAMAIPVPDIQPNREVLMVVPWLLYTGRYCQVEHYLSSVA